VKRLLRRLGQALGWPGPARWRDDPELDAAVARHPAGKRIPSESAVLPPEGDQ